MKWHLKENYTKISNEIVPPYLGIVSKILLVSGYLMSWGIILLGTFLLLN